MIKLIEHGSNLICEGTKSLRLSDLPSILPERFTSTSQPCTTPILSPEYYSTTMPNLQGVGFQMPD